MVDILYAAFNIAVIGGLLAIAVTSRVKRHRSPLLADVLDDSTPEATLARLTEAITRAAPGLTAQVGPYREGEIDNELETGIRFEITGLHRSIALGRVEGIAGTGATGDPEFDPIVDAPRSPEALALLDARCRDAIRRLLRGSIRIGRFQLDAGTLVVHVPTTGFVREHPGLDQAAHAVGALARMLVKPGDLVPLLAANATGDPQPLVRLANLEMLIEDFGGDSRTRDATRRGLTDLSHRVRLRAATALGAEGRSTLADLAVDPSADDDVAERAIEAIGAALPLARIGPLVQAAGSNARPAVVEALLVSLGRNPAAEAFHPLERLVSHGHDAFGRSIVDALTAIPRPDVERVLIKAVGSLTSGPRLLQAAARALGHVGTARAVPVLREAVDRRLGAGLTEAAQRSIELIQSRLVHAPGALALAGDQDGQVSLATDPDGRVSLPEDEH